MSVYLHSFRFIWRVPFWQEYHHNLIAEIVQHRSGLLCRWPFWPEGLYNQPLAVSNGCSTTIHCSAVPFLIFVHS